MIHFAVVAGSPAAVNRLAPRLLPSLDATRLFDAERVERIGVGRTWALAAITAGDPTCPTHLAADDDGMIVMNGPALSTRGNQGRLAEDVLRAFRSGGTADVAAILGGSYNFVGLSEEHGLSAFADPSGLFPLYCHQGPDFALFSNRSTTIAKVAEPRSGWDIRALAWVIGHANLFGEQMPARSARYLPPGYEAHVGRSGSRIISRRSPVWVWPEASNDGGRDNLTSSEWDEITDALVTNFRALRSFSGRLQLFLTGGKDSRLCLALAKSAGLQDHMRTITSGAVDSPEVECAAAVAEAAGFPHKQAGRPMTTAQTLAANAPFDPDAVWRRLGQHVYRFEAIVCPWDGVTDPLRNTTVNIKGFGGEFYRRSHAKRFRGKQLTSVEAMAAMFVNYHQRLDPLGVLRRAEVEFQSDWLKSWVHEEVKRIRLDLAPEKFYVDYRLGHWNGPMGQSTPWRINVNPLLLPAATRKNLELKVEVRSSERFHFEVMRRAAPELVAVPFLNDVWAPEIAADAKVELPREPYPTAVKPSAHTLKSWQWKFLESQSNAIARLFKVAARDTDMGTICNMRKLRQLARHSDRFKRVIDAKAVLSATMVALALLERAEPVLDRP
ncbi:MAG: hypothetical protein ACJ73V_01995 [Acidimicrobiia bacterium]